MTTLTLSRGDPRASRAIEGAYEAMRRGTPEALRAVVADDIEIWIRGKPHLAFAGTWSGPEGAASFLESYAANVRSPVFTTRYFMVQEDGAGLVVMHFVLEEGTAAPTGRGFASESVHEWRLDEAHRITRFASWNNTFDFYQAFAPQPVDPTFVFRHPLEDALITPTRPCAADPGIAVERFYMYLLSGDADGLLSLMAPNLVSTLEGVEGVVPFAGTFRGVEGMTSHYSRFARHARAYVDKVVPRYVVDGNRACCRFDEAGTYVLARSFPLFFPNLHCFTVNDAGQIEAFRSYNDTWLVWLALTPEDRRPAFGD